MLLYVAEVWKLFRSDSAILGVVQREFQRKIFASVYVGKNIHNQKNKGLYDLLNDMYVIEGINIARLRWHCHVIRLEENVPGKRVVDTGTSRCRQRERPSLRWKNQMLEIISSFSV